MINGAGGITCTCNRPGSPSYPCPHCSAMRHGGGRGLGAAASSALGQPLAIQRKASGMDGKNLVEVKTAELIGPALNWAVAKATYADEVKVVEWGDGKTVSCIYQLPGDGRCWANHYSPSTEWDQGGPLLESEQVELKWNGVDGKAFFWKAWHQDFAAPSLGDTPLIAACRAIVAAKLGDVVLVPAELVEVKP